MNKTLYRLLAIFLVLGLTMAVSANCASDESEPCGTEDALCTFLLLQSNELLMNLSISGTALGGAGEGDTVTVNVYPSSDTTCSGTASTTFSFSFSTFDASTSKEVPGSALKGGEYNIQMTRGSTTSNCDSARVIGASSYYYCYLSASTLNCSD